MELQSLDLPAGLSVSLKYREYTQTYRLFKLLCTYPPPYSCSAELATFLHAGNDRRVGRLFCATVHCLMMGLSGPKHVGVCVEKHYGNSNGVRAFVGHVLTVES
jgi:hypothetical protein